MDALTPLLLIFGAIVLGAMSPGPSLVYVSRIAMARSRLHAVAAAFGMGIGGVTFAIAAIAGLGAVLHYAEWAYLGLKIVGGAYLLYLGIRMWLHAGKAAIAPEAVATGSYARTLGAATLAQLSNPKAVVVYGSVFAARFSAWIDRIAGTVLGGLGAYFAFDGIRTAVR